MSEQKTAKSHQLISFVMSETKRLRKGEVLEQKPAQSAPKYYEATMPKQFAVQEENHQVKGYDVKFLIRSYPPSHILVKGIVTVPDAFSEETFHLRSDLIDACYKILEKRGGREDLSEEYSIALVSGYEGDPEHFLGKRQEISRFLKSENELLSDEEIEYTLSTKIKYSKEDLVIVDWDGAFVFDSEGQVEDIIDLIQTANLQLLRYRSLDSELDDRLHKVTKLPQKAGASPFSKKRNEVKKAFLDVIEARSKSIADFESIDRDIKLIGDWYSARLYDLLFQKFRLSDWRKSIQRKLDSLQDIYEIVSENFTVSRTHYLEFAQIIFFFILQAGWFALIILEFLYFTR